MKTYKTIQTERVLIDTITCNSCGQEIEIDPTCWSRPYETFSIAWGYGSKNDLDTWEFDLCEDCILKMTEKFKIQPDKKNVYQC